MSGFENVSVAYSVSVSDPLQPSDIRLDCYEAWLSGVKLEKFIQSIPHYLAQFYNIHPTLLLTATGNNTNSNSPSTNKQNERNSNSIRNPNAGNLFTRKLSKQSNTGNNNNMNNPPRVFTNSSSPSPHHSQHNSPIKLNKMGTAAKRTRLSLSA